ncbi:MAG: PRC-barrel domain-containing protein, partial [Armatimonadetes bacterium]|nr:PRC-barrel domain-containing protein [Armatimonadota bacterium]
MIFFSEGYLSELLRMNVVDRDGTFVGRIGDIGVKLGESFPLVTKIVLRRRGRKEPVILPWDAVRSVSTEAVTLSRPIGEIQPAGLDEGEILLLDSVLDNQIVDVQGHRVVRVNDVKLGGVRGQVRLVAAAVGTRSLLRRLN